VRVSEIKDAIEAARAVLAAGGAESAERELARLVELLAAQGDRDLDDYLSDVSATFA
jgi:hypothetical protein